jgi:hypothetical protein
MGTELLGFLLLVGITAAFAGVVPDVANAGAGDGCGGAVAAVGLFGDPVALDAHTVADAGLAKIYAKGPHLNALTIAQSHNTLFFRLKNLTN